MFDKILVQGRDFFPPFLFWVYENMFDKILVGRDSFPPLLFWHI